MSRTVLKKQIPTILALLILFVGAGAGVFLVGRGADFLPRAGPEESPKNLRITNVSERSFSVSWQTDAPVSGFIQYGPTPSLGSTMTDDRDQLSGQTGQFRTHHVTVKGLTPGTQYYFTVGSGSRSMYDNNGSAYTVTTSTATSAVDPKSMYGQVLTQAQTPAEHAVVYVTLEGGAPLSALVKAPGSWALSLSSVLTADLSRSLEYDPDTTEISIEVLGPDGSITRGVTSTSNDQPVPTIVLGQTFDFRPEQPTTASTPQPSPVGLTIPEVSPGASASGFSLAPIREILDNNYAAEIELINPKEDGEQLNTTTPEFRGIGPEQTTLTITVNSPVAYTGSVITDAEGNFSWTPPAELEPGEHTITVSYRDQAGVLQYFRRTFTVYAQGNSNLPAFTSTPSASIAPSPTPTPRATLTPAPTPRASAMPTATPRPTASPMVSPTPSPRVSQPATTSAIPVAGLPFPTLMALIFGVSLVGAGVMLTRSFE